MDKCSKIIFIKKNPENKITIKEENINSNQKEMKQKKIIIEKTKHISLYKSFKIEKNNNIYNNLRKKNNKSIQRIYKNFHIKFQIFYFLVILFIIPFINSSQISSNYNDKMGYIIKFFQMIFFKGIHHMKYILIILYNKMLKIVIIIIIITIIMTKY